MRAIRIHETGGAEKIRVDDIPVPTPGAGEVRFRVEAAGLNFIDTYKRSGLYAVPLPHTLGQEVTHYAREVVAPIFSRELWGLYREELAKGDYAEARAIVGALGQVARLQDGAVARERTRLAVARFPRLMRALLAVRSAARPGRS